MFKITTFPKGKLVETNTKAEAGKSCVVGVIESFNDLQSLVKRASEVPICPSNLKDAKRAAANFISTNLIIIDVDDMMNLEEAIATLDAAQIEFGIYTSFSHTKQNNKFHVVIPLENEINNQADFKATYEYIAKEIFGSINDNQTSSVANLFFNGNPKTVETFFNMNSEDIRKCKVVQSSTKKVETLVPSLVKQDGNFEDKLSKRTLRFLGMGAENGQWHNELKIAVKNLKAAGAPIEYTINVIKKITGELTESDLYQIKYGYENNTWDYDVSVVNLETHPLRLKYMDANGKNINIPAREVVKAFLIENDVTITASGNIKSGVNETDLSVLKEMIRDFAETQLKMKVPLAIIESVLSNIRETQRLQQLTILKDRIRYTGVKFDFDEWSKALIGRVDQVTISIMKHFIWQIKRKLSDKDVKYPIMPVFYGKTGAGKSYHLRHHILKPIKDIVYFDGDFKKLVDSREAYNLASHYVYFLDEMSKAENADVESIKNKITSDTIQYRKLGTNETVRGTNRVTFVGTTNLPLSMVIKDPTSVRRFFEIRIREKMDFAKISSLNYEAMWQSIDENINDDPFYMQLEDQITSIQETFRHKSIIEEFLLEIPISNDMTLSGDPVSRKELYDIFRTWVADSGYRHPINKHTFFHSLKEHVGEPVKYKIDGEVTYSYLKINTKGESHAI